MHKFSNRLAGETSPYLLQHAHNPVNWYPWGEEAWNKAVTENKPVLVSIGYSACHWCHVMERESFEDEETAALMNAHFVNIKIDREERPDLDHIYMDAVQAMEGSGGWPLNVFLTPDKKPFYGGTYFPPRAAFNRASWKEVLTGVARAFAERRNEIEQQASNLVAHITNANDFGTRHVSDQGPGTSAPFQQSNATVMLENILKAADKVEGGFSRAPKFPQTFTIQFLLHHHYYTGSHAALAQANLTLDKMIRGGIYDQLGGGFARYSTDAKWLAPHFEKMLYDNALLVGVLAEAFQLSREQRYAEVIRETLGFVERELQSGEGGFYSALDADSEGVEGKFYVWTQEEIEDVLGEDAPLFCRYYGVTPEGNWEQVNILHVPIPPADFAEQSGMSCEVLEEKMLESRLKLFERRGRRQRPQLDDKIILGWNALMIIAYCKAYAATGEMHFKKVAVDALNFVLSRFAGPGGSYFHTYKEMAKHPAFLDDYAYLVLALIHAQEITADAAYLVKAKEVTAHLLENFSDDSDNFFFFTGRHQQDVIVRKKEVYDGAVPSGNGIMAINLYYLGIIFDNLEWRERSLRLAVSLQDTVKLYPTSFGIWATLIQAVTFGVPEIALVGENFDGLHREVLNTYIPLKIFQASANSIDDFPLLSGKPHSKEPLLYLCKNYSCQTPVSEMNGLIRLMQTV